MIHNTILLLLIEIIMAGYSTLKYGYYISLTSFFVVKKTNCGQARIECHKYKTQRKSRLIFATCAARNQPIKTYFLAMEP
jgi:hypothetical protein